MNKPFSVQPCARNYCRRHSNTQTWMDQTMTTDLLLDMSRRQGGGLLDLLVRRLAAPSKRRALRKTLLSYDDHLLRDIGLSRHQVLSDEF
jgi:hypothetical protein